MEIIRNIARFFFYFSIFIAPEYSNALTGKIKANPYFWSFWLSLGYYSAFDLVKYVIYKYGIIDVSSITNYKIFLINQFAALIGIGVCKIILKILILYSARVNSKFYKIINEN